MKAVIVGIDGSLAAYGIAVISVEDAPRVLKAECFRTKPDPKSKHNYAADKDGVRVDMIATGVLATIDWAISQGVPVLVAIESPAGSQHATGAKALGLAYGISRTACLAKGLIPITVQAHEAKIAVGGSKGASKADVADGVEKMTGYRSKARSDEASEGESDAIAVALTALKHPMAHLLRKS